MAACRDPFGTSSPAKLPALVNRSPTTSTKSLHAGIEPIREVALVAMVRRVDDQR
ncbi:MAG: hypothetical protein RLY70_3311 [Planctomycetota bacterium]|jgi:hypothetical protein